MSFNTIGFINHLLDWKTHTENSRELDLLWNDFIQNQDSIPVWCILSALVATTRCQ